MYDSSPDPTLLDLDAWMSDIRVEVADRPLPVRMRLDGWQQRMTSTLRHDRPRLPGWSGRATVQIAGVTGLALLFARDRRRS